MNARREAKYRAAETQIVNAKITRSSKIACAGLMVISVGCAVFFQVSEREKTLMTLGKSSMILNTIQSGIDKTFDKMYEVMNVGVSFKDEKDHIIPVKKPVVLD